MNARHQSIERGLTGIARKVFEVVPMQEMWPISQIVSEMARIHQSRPDARVVHGCLDSLIGSGLVRMSQGRYCRTVSFEQQEEPIMANSPPPARVLAEDPISKLGRLAESMRELAQQATATADAIDAAAIEVDEAIRNAQKGDAQLNQLRALLKNLV